MASAGSLAEALEQIRQGCEELDLQSIGIGDEGAKELAAAFKTNKTLTELQLYRNKIGNEGAKQLAAALALGAEGMNMGTRFMATVEAPIHANIKQALVDGDEHSTTLIMRSLKNTERVFNNKTAKKVLEIEAEFPGQFEKIQPWVSGNRYEHDIYIYIYI